MKKLFLVLLLLTGCASSSTKASAYCDENWSGRYDSWQACYDHELPNQNKGLKILGTLLGGAGGSQNSQTTTCYNYGNMVQCK